MVSQCVRELRVVDSGGWWKGGGMKRLFGIAVVVVFSTTGAGQALRATAGFEGKGSKALVEGTVADETRAGAVARVDVMEIGLGNTIVLIIREVVVEDQVLDTLLLGALGLLLIAHSNSKVRVGGQID